MNILEFKPIKKITTMSKFEEAIDVYKAEFDKLSIKYDEDLLRKATKACGPSIYLKDASKVSASDPEELGRVKKNFLMKKLGMADDASLDEGINAVIEQFGKSNRNKYRAMFYYLLLKHFGKTL